MVQVDPSVPCPGRGSDIGKFPSCSEYSRHCLLDPRPFAARVGANDQPVRLYKLCTAHLARCGLSARRALDLSADHSLTRASRPTYASAAVQNPNIRTQPQPHTHINRRGGTLLVSDVGITKACVSLGGLSSPSSRTSRQQAIKNAHGSTLSQHSSFAQQRLLLPSKITQEGF